LGDVKEECDVSNEVKIGHVSHYFGKLGVAAIELTDGDLSVGDTVHIKGHTSDFTQKVGSIQIEHNAVPHADKGQSVGIRVLEHAREHDVVYKVLP
jgi:putative protease